MTKLSVNINKVATVRNARGGNNPDVIRFAQDCERFGAEGITVHPRPDERHITKADVYALAPVVNTEFNIEGFPDERYIQIVNDVRPVQATLVPDAPGVLTSNAGWRCKENARFLSDVISRLKASGARVSIFVDTDLDNIRAAAELGAQRVELYTEPYASSYALDREAAITPYIKAAELAASLGLGINAGHDLSCTNLKFFHSRIPFIDEVSIGHALICDALYVGIENAIREYKKCLTD